MKGSKRPRFRRGGFTIVVAVAAWVALAAAPAPAATPRPVPSLEPAKTAKLWRTLVRRPHTFARSARTADCRPLRAVFYTSTDWLRLATKLAADPSPCAQYFVSIPPLAADKTVFRYDQPWRIRALGPQFHVLAEINYTGWSKWVTANYATWYDAGVEARRRMAASGFDVASGDSWVVNEFSSAVRAGTGTARQNVRDLVRGLYDGDGTAPRVQGAVFITGMGQSTSDLSLYKYNVQNWYLDSAFWQDMSAYVADWSQEVYGDARDYAVAGASLAERRDHLDDYLGHQFSLADVAPPEAATAQTFLRQAYSPLANAAWIYESGFGFTNVPLAQMQDYVTAQTDALRSFDAAQGLTQDRFGFAWAPKMVDNSAWTPDFVTQSGQVLERLAAAVRESGATPDGACGTAWCTAAVDGAAFVETWKTFATWSPPALGFATAPATLTAGVPAGPLSVRLQQVGIAQTTESPVAVTLSSSAPTGVFSPSADGPWTSTLDVTIPAGASSASFFYRDTQAGTPTLTATAEGRQPATQRESVVAGPVATLAVTPASATVASGASTTFTAAAADAYGNAVAVAPTWSTTAPGTITGGGVFTASPATGGTGSVFAGTGGVTATASVTVTPPRLRVPSIAYATSSDRLVITFTVTRTSDGAPIAGAIVSFTLFRNGVASGSATVQTDAYGRATVFTSAKASNNCYSTALNDVTGAGLAWDGATPVNQYCK